MFTTSRLGLEGADGTTAVSGYPAIDLQAKDILDNAVLYSEGTLASRPAAAIKGRIYHGTDTGFYYWDTGSAWQTALLAGAWQSLTLGTGVGIAGDGDGIAARAEGDIARLKGLLKGTTTVAAGATLATIPTAVKPPFGIATFPTVLRDNSGLASGLSPAAIYIDAVGNITANVGIDTTHAISLHGITYPLT